MSISPFVMGLIPLASCPPDSPMWHVAELTPLVKLKNIPLHGYVSHLFIRLFISRYLGCVRIFFNANLIIFLQVG